MSRRQAKVCGIVRSGPRLLPAFAALAALLVAPSAHAGDVFKGRDVYTKQCQICHGRAGVATMAGAPDLSRGEGLLQPDPSLLGSIKAGANAMPAYTGILSDREILDVIAYMRTLMR
jgi:cytochrome c6